ncbi:hypothetical protein SAVIM40S_04104 [Streptomyces avidinii]
MAQRERFRQLGDLLGGVGGEDGVRPEFGHEVVVVGVEPLGHLQRGDVLGAPGHREEAVECVGLDGRAVPLGNSADHDTGVQDVVVVREVTGRHLGDPGVGQLLPVRTAEVGRGLPEGVGGDAALPVALDGPLQFAVLSLAGVAVNGGSCCRGCGLRCHGTLLREMCPEHPGDGTRTRRKRQNGRPTSRKTPHVPLAVYADPPTRSPEMAACERSRAGNGQVFGLAGTPAGLPAGTYWPSLPRTVVRSQCV